MTEELSVRVPDWALPGSVLAVQTTRLGGCSAEPWDGLNLSFGVEDSPQAVAGNREQLRLRMGCSWPVQFCRQQHGAALTAVAEPVADPDCDALYTRRQGLACAVLTADCLPVLLCARDGTEIAAVHAGWRGLASGILRVAVQGFAAVPQNLSAWLGPAICQQHYEVGSDMLSSVRSSFSGVENCLRPGRPGHWQLSLRDWALHQLRALGLKDIAVSEDCSHCDPQLYSLRRDRVTGRMASVILLR